jgi:hypothetical protein
VLVLALRILLIFFLLFWFIFGPFDPGFLFLFLFFFFLSVLLFFVRRRR